LDKMIVKLQMMDL